ncbi:hypothetical protein D3C78_939250 [compost metagenome]
MCRHQEDDSAASYLRQLFKRCHIERCDMLRGCRRSELQIVIEEILHLAAPRPEHMIACLSGLNEEQRLLLFKTASNLYSRILNLHSIIAHPALRYRCQAQRFANVDQTLFPGICLPIQYKNRSDS